MCGLGIAGIVESFLDLHRMRAAVSWPVAEGRIVRSAVKTRHAWQDDYTESLKLTYVFEIGGREYTGHRVKAGQGLDLIAGFNPGSAWSTARDNAQNYPAGSPVAVRYDPRNPRTCCLETGGLPGVIVKQVVCLVLVVAGAGLISTSRG